jgi:acetoin utilization deacetylase AcuC-like enzyme
MSKTGIVKDYRYLEHITGDYHPESHHRLEIIYEMLEGTDMAGKFLLVEPRFATRKELEYVHTSRYISQVAETAGKPRVMLDPDTQTSPKSWEAAQLAAGGFLELIDQLMQKEIDNGFAFIRPPGHHAEANRAMGFCLFNNVAIGAKYAIKKYNLDRILIIDWDLHHGNATQHTFYDDLQVLYFSTHQYPYYPGTGHFDEVGEGEGRGFTVNVPLPAGPGDDEYARIYLEILKPITLEYKPEMIMVSAGFDTYFQDPLGGMRVTPEGFARLTKIILELAKITCGGKILITLEGGYHLEGLRDSVKAVLLELREETSLFKNKSVLEKKIKSTSVDSVIKRVKTTHQTYWSNL